LVESDEVKEGNKKLLQASSSDAELFSKNLKNKKLISMANDRKRWFGTRSMSWKDSLEHTVRSQNNTMEIENQIKEMNIIHSYERPFNSVHNRIWEEQDLKEDHELFNSRGRVEINNLKEKRPYFKKSASSSSFISPLLLKSKDNVKGFKQSNISNLKKYNKIRGLMIQSNSDANLCKFMVSLSSPPKQDHEENYEYVQPIQK